MNRLKSVVPTIGVVLAVLGLPAISADAHTVSNHYSRWWVDNSRGDLNVDWHFTSGFPSGSYRSRVRDGAAQWNALAQPMRFVEGSQVSNFNPEVCPSSYQYDGIHWGSIDGTGGTAAWVSSCFWVVNGVNTSELHSVQQKYDSAEDWYTGTGDANDGFLQLCIPSCQIDLWSIASHEWGHSTGWGTHLPANESICANDSNQNTMCPTYYGGTERMRTLESHDIHTFNGRY